MCSTALTYILTESDKLFTFGANFFDECGNIYDGVSESEPQCVNVDGNEGADIAAGFQHRIAVMKHAAVFGYWGGVSDRGL